MEESRLYQGGPGKQGAHSKHTHTHTLTVWGDEGDDHNPGPRAESNTLRLIELRAFAQVPYVRASEGKSI